MGEDDLYASALDYYLRSYVANINKELPIIKCADNPKDGKANRRERRKQERRRRKGRL